MHRALTPVFVRADDKYGRIQKNVVASASADAVYERLHIYHGMINMEVEMIKYARHVSLVCGTLRWQSLRLGRPPTTRGGFGKSPGVSFYRRLDASAHDSLVGRRVAEAARKSGAGIAADQRQGGQKWTSGEAARSRPARALPSGSPARSASIRCFRQLTRRARPVPV
jgi:hypothetical protein